MLSGPRNTLVRPYAATRSDRGQRKEFVHEDKHRIRPCRQTERARLRLGTSVNHPADPTTNMQRKKPSRRRLRSDLLSTFLVPRHVQIEDYEETLSEYILGRGFGRFFFKTHLFRAVTRVAQSRYKTCTKIIPRFSY